MNRHPRHADQAEQDSSRWWHGRNWTELARTHAATTTEAGLPGAVADVEAAMIDMGAAVTRMNAAIEHAAHAARNERPVNGASAV